MTRVEFTWADIWAYYPAATRETQRDILEALKEVMKGFSMPARVKALDGAPLAVVKAHAHLLDDRAKKKLGLAVEKMDWSSFL